MSDKKLTKMDKFSMLKSIPEVAKNPVLFEFITKEMELLAKKSASAKPTATQLANEGFKNAIIDCLEADMRPRTVTELIKEVPELSELSNQRVTSLVTQLKKDEIIDKVMIKRKAYFFPVGMTAEDATKAVEGEKGE